MSPFECQRIYIPEPPTVIEIFLHIGLIIIRQGMVYLKIAIVTHDTTSIKKPGNKLGIFTGTVECSGPQVFIESIRTEPVDGQHHYRTVCPVRRGDKRLSPVRVGGKAGHLRCHRPDVLCGGRGPRSGGRSSSEQSGNAWGLRRDKTARPLHSQWTRAARRKARRLRAQRRWYLAQRRRVVAHRGNSPSRPRDPRHCVDGSDDKRAGLRLHRVDDHALPLGLGRVGARWRCIPTKLRLAWWLYLLRVTPSFQVPTHSQLSSRSPAVRLTQYESAGSRRCPDPLAQDDEIALMTVVTLHRSDHARGATTP